MGAIQPGIRRQSSPAASWSRAAPLLAVALACLLALAGCQSIPADPDGTLDRVRGGVLRVGGTHSPPWVDTTNPEAPAGTEVLLAERIAAELDSRLEWTLGSEAVLAERLHAGHLDLVVGGFTEDTPWTDRAATTAPYLEDRDEAGKTRRHVLLTRPGENRFLTVVDQILAGSGQSR